MIANKMWIDRALPHGTAISFEEKGLQIEFIFSSSISLYKDTYPIVP
jgi:hypothetical protein